jgi:hypothetical protein
VLGGKLATTTAAVSLQKVGVLDKGTDITKLVNNTFIQLEGIDDVWVQSVEAK